MNLDEEGKSNNLSNNDLLQPNQEDPSMDYEEKNEPQKLTDFANVSRILKKPLKEINKSRHKILPPIEQASNSSMPFNKSKQVTQSHQTKVIPDDKLSNPMKPSNIHPTQESRQYIDMKSCETLQEPPKKSIEQIGDTLMLETRKLRRIGEAISDSTHIAVMCGDFITSQSLYTLEQGVNAQWSADKYIRQSLFTVECKQNYTKAYYWQKLFTKSLPKNDKARLISAMKDAKNEEQTNEAEQVQRRGTPIQYGQVIQLRHIFTHDYVVVSIHEIAKEGRAQKVTLSKGSEKAWLQFMPGTKTSKLGDLVRYGDSILIMSKADQDNCYLHSADCSALCNLAIKKVKLSDDNMETKAHILEVNASVQASNWRPRKCADSCTIDPKEDIIKVGDMFKLYHVNTESFLTLAKKDTTWKLMKRLKQNPNEVSLDVYLTNKQDNEAALYWQLERAERYLGGPANWEGFYKLRHVLTGMHLTYSIKGDFKVENDLGLKKIFIQMRPINVVIGDGVQHVVDHAYFALMIGGGVIVPAQTSPEEMPVADKAKVNNMYEEKLFFRERGGSLSSNCIYQIQKVSASYELRVRQGMIFFDNFFYYKNELSDGITSLNRKADFVESDQSAKNKQKLLNSTDTSLILSELSFKLELFLEILNSGEEKSIILLKETQDSLFDTFNLDSLVRLLKLLETKFVSPNFIQATKQSSQGYLCKLDHKIKYPLDSNNLLIDSYTKLTRLIYRSLHKLSLNNRKTSTGVISAVNVFSGQIYNFNKEVRKLLGVAIPCSMPFTPSGVDHVGEWFKLLAPLVKTQNSNNVIDQLVALKVLRGLCLGNDGKGDVANQRACFKLLQNSTHVTIGFGVEESRPYIYFSKGDKIDQNFLNNNPILASYSRTLDYDKNNKIFCVHLDDLSKNQKSTIDYIYYVAHVLRLFSAMCVGRFNPGIMELTNRGFGGYHLISCLKMNTPGLHPKLMQAYLELTKVMCIDVDPLTSILTSVNRCYFWDDFNNQNDFDILSQEDNRLNESNEKEIMYRINEIRSIFEEYLSSGPRITPADDSDACKQNLKIAENWLSIAKGLLEYRQLTSEFLDKLIPFVIHILSSREDAPFSGALVSQLISNGVELDWVRALLEQAKTANQTEIKILKEIALEVLILIYQIRNNLHIIGFLKTFKLEYAAGYTPHDRIVSLNDIKKKIEANFAETRFELHKKPLEENDMKLGNLFVGKTFQDNDKTASVWQPLDLTLLGLVFEESRGFTGINKKAMTALTLSFKQKQRLVEEAAKIDIVVSDDDVKLYKELLREKRLAKIFIDNILNQNMIIDKTDKTAKEKKGMSDLQELLQRVIILIQTPETKLKAQNFMTHLQFHTDLINLLQVTEIDLSFIRPLLKLVVQFLFLFCQNYSANQLLIVPYVRKILALHNYGIKVSKLLHQIFIYTKSQKEERWLTDYLLEELKTNDLNVNPDVMRLLASLANSSSDKHSKYILKSLLVLDMQKYIMMSLEETALKNSLGHKWRRDKQCQAGLKIKTHIYMIATIGSCAIHSDYGRIQGSKLIPENHIFSNLMSENTSFLLKSSYLQLYYCLYIYSGVSKASKELPKLFPSVLKVILKDIEKAYHYEFALDLLYKKKKLLNPFIDIGDNEEKKSINSGGDEEVNESQGNLVKLNQKREKDAEYFHKPDEYWKMLFPKQKIEIDSGGILNFLCKTFTLHSWNMNETTFSLISNIRTTLMSLFDYLYKVYEDRNKELNMDDLLLMICKTLECLPTSIKPAIKNSGLHIDTQPEENCEESNLESVRVETKSKYSKGCVESDVISDTHRHLREGSEDLADYNDPEISANREKESYEFVIKIIQNYIIQNDMTIREAFKLFDSNIDRRIERLELKKAIKDICGTQIVYQQIEEAVNHIEKTIGSSSAALMFSEFSAALKKVLKKSQYKNYKQRVVDVTDVRMDDDEMENSVKINTTLKHFIIDYKRCVDYFPDDIELKELAKRISSIMHYLLKKSKVSDISVFMAHLIKAFDKNPYKDHLMDIFMCILLHHQEELKSIPSKRNTKRLSNIIKIFIREFTLSKAIDVLVDESDVALNKKACEFINTLLKLCKENKDSMQLVEAQQTILNYLTRTRKFEEMFRKIKKTFSSCMRKLKKKYRPEEIKVYNSSLFLANLNVSQTIKKIDKIELFSYTKSLLQLLSGLAGNSFIAMQEFLRTQTEYDVFQGITSVNLLSSTGLLLISLTELDSDIYLYSDYYRLLPYIFNTLIQMCTGTCTKNQVYLGTWVKFIRCLNFFLIKPIPWNAEAEDNVMKQKAFFCVIQLLNSLLSDESTKAISNTILKELDIWSLRWKLSEIYRMKLMLHEKHYNDNIVCNHNSKDLRTCTFYSCSYGYLSNNDKTIIKAAFDAFIFLSKVKEQHPDNLAIESFGKNVRCLIKKSHVVNNSQVLPVFKTIRSTSFPEINDDYSMITESDNEDIYNQIEEKKESYIGGCCNCLAPKACYRHSSYDDKTGLGKSDVQQLIVAKILQGIVAKKHNLTSDIKSKAGAIILSKLRRQEQLERERKKTDIAIAEKYYESNIRSIEIY